MAKSRADIQRAYRDRLRRGARTFRSEVSATTLQSMVKAGHLEAVGASEGELREAAERIIERSVRSEGEAAK